MITINLISIAMVLVGVGLLSASIASGFRLSIKLPDQLQKRWQLLTALMVFFDVSYVIFVFLLISGFHFPIELLVGIILFAGAIFVFLFIKLTESTIARMNDLQQKGNGINDELQEANRILLEQAEEHEKISSELRSSKTELENVFNNAIPLCITNREREIIRANDVYYQIFGKPGKGKTQKCFESRPGSTCKTERCPLERIAAGAAEVICESTKEQPDGSYFYFMVTARPFKGEDGEMVGIVESFQDITKLKLAEEALEAEKERLLVTLKSIVDGVIAIDVNGRVVLMNETAQNLTGWKQEYAAGRKLSEVMILLDSHDRRQIKDLSECLANMADLEKEGSRAILVAKDGWERNVSYSISPIHDRRQETIGTVLVFQDITEKLKVEMDSARVQKLESIGLLAGGIAHDFNNILTSIMNNLAMVRLMKDSADKVLEKIESTEKAVLKAKGLTGQLLTFAKGGSPAKKIITISDLVEDSVEFALRGSNVRADVLIEDGIKPVEVDSSQMHQVVSNLIINAYQAMPEGGVVKISVINCMVNPGESKTIPPGEYVRLSVRDEGPGIKEEILSNIFDPYFTTKEDGSGLGLATVYSIVSKHGGYVDVDSESGKGANFMVYIPALPKEDEIVEQEIIPDKTSPVSKADAGRRILIMDDEEDIRELLSELLAIAGFEVVASADGSEAMRLYNEARAAGRGFDCVIMDLTIPGGMGGKETISKILDGDPEAKAIVSSGYSNDPVMADYAKYGFSGRVAKPYRLEELVEAINAVITQD